MNSVVIFAALLATVAAGARENIPAPPGFTYLGSSPTIGPDGQSIKHSSYYISNGPASWDDAAAHCISSNLNHLMSINDQVEDSLVSFLLYSNDIENTWVWTSGSHDYEQYWRWVGSEINNVTYTSWRTGQPTQTAQTYHIAIIGNGDDVTYGWGSISRGTSWLYVCEVPIPVTIV